MNMVVHPSAISRGIENAQHIVWSPLGSYSYDDTRLAALTLKAHATDFIDTHQADRVLVLLSGDAFDTARREHLEQTSGTGSNLLENAVFFMACAFAVSTVIAVVVAG